MMVLCRSWYRAHNYWLHTLPSFFSLLHNLHPPIRSLYHAHRHELRWSLLMRSVWSADPWLNSRPTTNDWIVSSWEKTFEQCVHIRTHTHLLTHLHDRIGAAFEAAIRGRKSSKRSILCFTFVRSLPISFPFCIHSAAAALPFNWNFLTIYLLVI